MHPVVLLLAGGAAFFAGLALLLAAALLRRHSTPRANRAAAWLALLAILALAASATPLPPWAYALLALPLALMPLATPTPRGRAAVAATSAAAILAVGALEAREQFLPVLRPAPERRVAIIGDSLTAGHGDDDRATPWPALLEARHGVAVENLARAGATAASAARDVLERPPEAPLVLVEIGGNDLLGGTPPEDFERALDALLAALDRPGRQVAMFELPLPPFHERYGRIQRRVAARRGVALIPERVLLTVLGGADATVDSIHLSQAGHERMAGLVWRFLGPALPAVSPPAPRDAPRAPDAAAGGRSAPAPAVLGALASLPLAAWAGPPRQRPRLLVHLMPWYSAPPHSPAWGWHWTMNRFDPGDGRPRPAGERTIASHYRPLVGPYDSGDPAIIEYQLLLMRLAGIDGVIVDWYGLTDHFDYAVLHRNTGAIVSRAGELGLEFAICYEDQTIPRLVEAGRIAPGDRVAHARREVDWLEREWFAAERHLRVDGRPVLLSFGAAGLDDAEWEAVLRDRPAGPAYVSEHRRRPVADGAFDWPIPRDHPAFLERFERGDGAGGLAIPVAFPRFHDIYEEAGVGPSHGRIDDRDGRTLADTLRRALALGSELVQIATWNDWGEGTGIEPTEEFGYRDLETVQEVVRTALDPAFPFRPADLRLPARLLALRRAAGAPLDGEALDGVARLIAAGDVAAAAARLAALEETNRQRLHPPP